MTKIVAPVGSLEEVSTGVARITIPVQPSVTPLPDPGVSWAANTAMSVGDRIKVVDATFGNLVLEVIGAVGTTETGASEPAWTHGAPLPVVFDGGVVWELIGVVGGPDLRPAADVLVGIMAGGLVPLSPVVDHGDLGSAATFDYGAGPEHGGTVTAALTLTLDGWPPIGTGGTHYVGRMVARLTNDGTGGYGVPTLGAEVVNAADWAAVWDDAPGAVNEVVFETWDGGTNVYLIIDLPMASLWVNVKAYGATGNGTTDDTSAFQAAMDATPAKGTCFVPFGTYKITSALTRTNGQGPIRLLGAGTQYGGSVVHQATGDTDGITISVVESSTLYLQDNASSIEHLKFLGPTGNSSGAGINTRASIHLDNVTVEGFYNSLEQGDGGYYGHVLNTLFTKADNAGFYSVTAPQANYRFVQTRFDSCAYGAFVEGTQIEGISFIDCAVERNTQCGLFLNGTHAALIAGCYFESNTSGADDIFLGWSNSTIATVIQSCWFTDYGSGVHVWHVNQDHAGRTSIIGSQLQGSGATGGDIKGTANTANVLIINSVYSTTSGLPASTFDLDPSSPPLSTADGATTVTDETTWGITPDVGTDPEYARQDHTHGSPPDPGSSGAHFLVISSTHSTPLVFDDIVQTSPGDDFVYTS